MAILDQGFDLRNDLHAAVECNAISVHYQPIACMETGGIVGFEVLARWDHPQHGPISPATFIPLAEELGLIVTLGEQILRQACFEAARWRQPLKIAVNLSPAQIEHSDIVKTVVRALLESGLEANRLDLEITEGLLITGAEDARTKLRKLQELGVRIAMDDFGTGYSSLGYFRSFPFDKVKIDQSFVRDMADSREAFAIVKAIIALGKGLGLAIIAEGVETEEQAYLLHQEGCEKVQGFLISRPAPIEHFDWAVRDHRSGSHRCNARCSDCIERLRSPMRARTYAFVPRVVQCSVA